MEEIIRRKLQRINTEINKKAKNQLISFPAEPANPKKAMKFWRQDREYDFWYPFIRTAEFEKTVEISQTKGTMIDLARKLMTAMLDAYQIEAIQRFPPSVRRRIRRAMIEAVELVK